AECVRHLIDSAAGIIGDNSDIIGSERDIAPWTRPISESPSWFRPVSDFAWRNGLASYRGPRTSGSYQFGTETETVLSSRAQKHLLPASDLTKCVGTRDWHQRPWFPFPKPLF